MRFMMIVKANQDSEAGVLPSMELLTEMGKFNEKLEAAGVLRSLDGLHPSSKGARVLFKDGQKSVVDGPFSETKELIAGYWIIEVASKQEAVDWALQCPSPHEGDAQIEIRQIFELSDFPDVPEGVRNMEERLRA